MRHRSAILSLDELRGRRYHVFVPALMGAGLVFSLATLALDVIHRRRGAHRSHRVELAAQTTAARVVTGESVLDLNVMLRPRGFYLVVGTAAGVAGIWVAIGALVNYLRGDGYASELAWLLALAMIGGGALCWLAAAVLVTYVRWPRPPAWTYRFLRAPLTQPRSAAAPGGAVPWHRGIEFWVALGCLIGVTIGVAASRAAIRYLDAGLTAVAHALPSLELFTLPEPLWRPGVAVPVALVVGLLALRCLPFAASYVAAVLLAELLGATIKLLVERPGPVGGPMAGIQDSYSNSLIAQATIMAGFLPLAVRIFTPRDWLARSIGAILTVVLIGAGLRYVQAGVSWPSDVIGGVLLGLTLVLLGRWVLAHRPWHANCHGCPWNPRPLTQVTQPLRHPEHVRMTLLRLAQVWTICGVAVFGVLAMTVGIPRDPDGGLVDSPIAIPVQLGLLALIMIAAVSGRRLPATAAVVLLLAGIGLGLFSALQYQPVVGGLVAMAFVAPSVLFWLAWQHLRHRSAVVVLAVLTAGLLVGGYFGAVNINDRMYGATHPESTTQLLAVDKVEWAWSGAIGPHEATLVAKIVTDADRARLVLRPAPGFSILGSEVEVPSSGIVRLPVRGLLPNTEYDYVVEVDGQADSSRGQGRLRTFPDGAASFTVAVASCARTGSNGSVFDEIRRQDPALFLEIGDLHYGDISEDSVQMFEQVYNRVLTSPAQAALYRSVPISYIWDDHDYGPNNADSSSPSRHAAGAAYREIVPHYPLPDPDGIATYQAFNIGRVRFILTDTRSQRTTESMLGERQLDWFEREMRAAARTNALVVWVNPDPWIGPDDPGADSWSGYPDERRHIAKLIAETGVPLVMLSGDAHMVAIDDGSNSDYSGIGRGFPVLQAAALDRLGSVKGGPYSEGAFPGSGQFGTLEVVDTGGPTLKVNLAGWNWSGRKLVSYSVTVSESR